MRDHYSWHFPAKFWAIVITAAVSCAVLFTVPQAHAAERPFPEYTLSFEWIHGQADPNWKTGDPGDGCLRSDDFEVTHLSTYGFNATINPCDGFRTTMKFYYPEGTSEADVEPTLQFRWGTTWQYKLRAEDSPWIWKPVENMKVNGVPVSTDLYDYSSQDAVVLKNDDGTWRHINGKASDFFEPRHVVFDAVMDFDETYEFTFDAYLPADSDYAGLSIGTGSTGDTEGGSIGAKANGLYVSIPGYADFRYVLDSEYRAARGITDETQKLPNRTLSYWGGPIDGSTYTVMQCLDAEGQHLADVMNSQPTTDIYPDLAKYPSVDGSSVLFQDADGKNLLAAYDYEYFVGQPGNWGSLTGLSLINLDANNKPVDFGDINIPYKPTFESVKREIPGYTYVDNDLPTLKEATLVIAENGNMSRTAGVNIPLSYHKYSAATAPEGTDPSFDGETQHLYFTYKPNPGSFMLTKQAEDGSALAGAQFELYEIVSDQATPCGIQPDLTDVETINVCEDGTCTDMPARRLTLDGFNEDGTFTTGEDGTFAPTGDPALLPGDYVVREVKAPEGYNIGAEYTPFTVPVQAALNEAGQLVDAAVPGEVTVTNTSDTPPPPEDTPPPSTPPTPPEISEHPHTGSTAGGIAILALCFMGSGVFMLKKSGTGM